MRKKLGMGEIVLVLMVLVWLVSLSICLVCSWIWVVAPEDWLWPGRATQVGGSWALILILPMVALNHDLENEKKIREEAAARMRRGQ